MDFPKSIKQNHPSRRVFIGRLGPKTKKPKRVLPSLETRGNTRDGVINHTAARKMLKPVTRLAFTAKSTTNGFAKPGASGPAVAPRPDEANNIFSVKETGNLNDPTQSERAASG